MTKSESLKQMENDQKYETTISQKGRSISKHQTTLVRSCHKSTIRHQIHSEYNVANVHENELENLKKDFQAIQIKMFILPETC